MSYAQIPRCRRFGAVVQIIIIIIIIIIKNKSKEKA